MKQNCLGVTGIILFNFFLHYFTTVPRLYFDSPIESSVRFVLQHLIEILQGFHLSSCLNNTHKTQQFT